jgi:hypothetical protein
MQISFDTLLLLFYVTVSNVVFVYIGYKFGALTKSADKVAITADKGADKPSVLDKVKDFVEDIVMLKKDGDKINDVPQRVTTKDGRDKYENDFF